MRMVAASLAVFVLTGTGLAAVRGPYAGLEDRTIKALSDDEIRALRSGEGAGMALPAELNGYPGPRHVLDLAGELNLTDEQQSAIARLFEDMQRRAIDLGEELIAAEGRLDQVFSGGAATSSEVAAATARAADLRGALRLHHLTYHLATKAILTEHQVAAYGRLRGYGGGDSDHSGHDGDAGHRRH